MTAVQVLASYDTIVEKWEQITGTAEYEQNPFMFSKEYEAYEDGLTDIVHALADELRDRLTPCRMHGTTPDCGWPDNDTIITIDSKEVQYA